MFGPDGARITASNLSCYGMWNSTTTYRRFLDLQAAPARIAVGDRVRLATRLPLRAAPARPGGQDHIFLRGLFGITIPHFRLRVLPTHSGCGLPRWRAPAGRDAARGPFLATTSPIWDL